MPEFFESIADLLRREDVDLHATTLESARCMIKKATATPEFLLESLAELLCYKDVEVNEAALLTVMCIGSLAATPAILAGLAQLLGCWDKKLLIGVVSAVRCIGHAAATPEISTRLVQLLYDSDNRVRSGASRALGEMMREGVRFFQIQENISANGIAELARHRPDRQNSAVHRGAVIVEQAASPAPFMPIYQGKEPTLRDLSNGIFDTKRK
jgi:HEAT repeat protein